MKDFPRLSIFSAIVVTAALILIATPCQAGPRNYKGEYNYKSEVPTEPVSGCWSEKVLNGGFYLGGGVSYDVYKFRQNTSAVSDEGVSASINPPINAKGWNGELFAGFGAYLQSLYLGAEIMANDSNVDANYSFTAADDEGTTSYNVNTKARYSYGVGLIPGVRVNDAALLYGRVGYIRTSLRTTESATAPTGSENITKTKWGNGFNYGLGIETAVARNVSIRAEYTYTSYNTMTSSVATKFTPSNNEFVFGLIYNVA